MAAQPCHTCNAPIAQHRSLQLVHSGGVFCVELKRFGYDKNAKAWNADKLPTPIHINSVLDLPGGRYSLRSMVLHTGDTTTSGHYRACVHWSDQWFLYNDGATQHFPACPPEAECTATFLIYKSVDAKAAPVIGATVTDGTFSGDVPNAMVTPTVAYADSWCAFAAPHPMPLPDENGTACIAFAVPAVRAAVVKVPEEAGAYVSAPPTAKGAADAERESADDAAEPAPASGADRDRHQRKPADESNRFLPSNFAGKTLRRDALKLLDLFVSDPSGSKGVAFLSSLPIFGSETHSTSFDLSVCDDDYYAALAQLVGNSVNGRAATSTAVYLGDTLPYPFAVQGILHGAVYCRCFRGRRDRGALELVVNKKTPLAFGRWGSKSRYWFCATANRGEGKSPCAKPLVVRAAIDAMEAYPAMSPGARRDRFHVAWPAMWGPSSSV